MTVTFTSIADLPANVDLASFTCGDATLDRWLDHHAKGDHARGRSHTTVVHSGSSVVGYYAVALHTIEPDGLTKAHTGKNTRHQSQAGYLLAKLAVSEQFQRSDIGSQLAVSAIRDCLHAADLVGGRIIVVDYQRPELAQFYNRLGFTHEAKQGRRVMLISDAKASLPSVD